MNRPCLAALALLSAGCARPQTPTVAVVPTAITQVVPTAIPTQIIVIAPPLDTATPTPDAQTQARKAVVMREITRLQSASPEQDFAVNWAAQNRKFVALRGVGWHIPSVPKGRVTELLNKYDATPIEGMSDVMEFPEEADLGRLAMSYATRYNQLLLAKLDEENVGKPINAGRSNAL